MALELEELIEAADLNGLLRAVDALCERRAWEELVDLADRCEHALERGKQLWPIAMHVDYRLALEAPGDYAAGVLDPDVTRFTLGPLTEVAASTHRWAELADHIDAPQTAAYVAQERVLRGEVLDGDDRAHSDVLDLPLHLEAWEPTYALATYRRDHVEVSEPWEPRAPLRVAEPATAPVIEDDDVDAAFHDLVHPWTVESNGAARAAIVEGDALGALGHLAFGSVRIGALSLDEALQRMAWAAASGGAHGRRRGAALGRFIAWYAAAVVADVSWPPGPRELRAGLERLSWYRWDEGAPEEGWVLRIAVEHRDEGWAAAFAATDLTEEDEGAA